jgi:hypothetical protein
MEKDSFFNKYCLKTDYLLQKTKLDPGLSLCSSTNKYQT